MYVYYLQPVSLFMSSVHASSVCVCHHVRSIDDVENFLSAASVHSKAYRVIPAVCGLCSSSQC